MKKLMILALVGAVSVTSCATVCDGSQEECGAGLGATAGLVAAAVIANNIDSDLAAALLGAGAVLGGAYIGQQYGQYLDERDAALAQEAAIEALNSREGTSSWSSEHNEGVSGTATVNFVADSSNCRIVDQLIVNDTGTHSVETNFCQQEDGTWRAMA